MPLNTLNNQCGLKPLHLGVSVSVQLIAPESAVSC